MPTRIFSILFILIFLSFHAMANDIVYELVPLKPGATPDPGSSYVIQNMPRATSQQALGLCYGHSAATVFNYYQCQAYGLDCPNAPKNQQASAFDMSRYSLEKDSKLLSMSRSDYSEIREGGNPYNALIIGALAIRRVVSQECVTEEMLFKEIYVPTQVMTEAQINAQLAYLQALESYYQQHTVKALACNGCSLSEEELVTFKKVYDTDKNAKQVGKILSLPTFSAFLSAIVMPNKCVRAASNVWFEYSGHYESVQFPKHDKDRNYTAVFGAIKRAISANNPVIVTTCVYRLKGRKNCSDEFKHSLVAYGYGKICKKNGKCRDVLKVMNSWGQEWQDTIGKEWFDAKRILASFDYKKDALLWLQRAGTDQ
ncbi:hypothetical protein H0A58_09820 [Alcaligenaceae bacterium]|nr:hypothetical protein [Alcaligenaceae bacterium]